MHGRGYYHRRSGRQHHAAQHVIGDAGGELGDGVGGGRGNDNDIRRIGEVAKLFTDANIITITAFISPYRQDRENARKLQKEDEFIEVYVKCPLDVCEQRDTKGLYKKARLGEVKEFTGISAPYEEPLNPELTIDTSKMSLEESTRTIISYLEKKEYVKF